VSEESLRVGQVDIFGRIATEARPLDRGLLERKLAAQLAGITASELVAMMYSPFDATVDFARLCRGDATGQQISSLFNPHRYATPRTTERSIVDALRDRAYVSGLARAIAWKEGKFNDLLYQVLQLGINGTQCVNEFPPHVARDILTENCAISVLDPCAGWGGRMIGAASVGARYVGYEPATATYDGLVRLGHWLTGFDTGFTYALHNQPFEDADLGSETFDLAVTSPPYFDTEKYSIESTQAAIRWPTPTLFVDGFLKPMVTKSVAVSRFGLIINIGSRRYPMKEWLKEVPGMTVEPYRARLSGGSGLGKENRDGETFWRICRVPR
jgi:hypothetical protein